MICLISARTLINAPPYGYWVYNGFNETVPAGPFNETPVVPLFPGYSTGDILYGGEADFILATDNKSQGFYSVTYVTETTSTTLIIQILDDAACVAEDQTLYFSDSTGSTDLTPYLDDAGCPAHQTGGTWVDLDTSGALTGSNFDPSAAGVGTWRIQYYFRELGFQEADCCDTTVTLTCVVNAAFAVFISSVDNTCTYTLDVADPVSEVVGDIDFILDETVAPDFFVIEYKRSVGSTCGDTYIDSTVQQYVPGHTIGLGVATSTSFPFATGGYVDTLRAFSVATGTIDIPLAPSGGNQAVFSGSGGTTNATELTYTAGASATWINALKIAIRNYLIDVKGLTEGTDFDLRLFGYSTSTNTLSIRFGIRHNAASSYVGLQRATSQITYFHNGVTTHTSTTDSVQYDLSVRLITSYSSSPCLTGGNVLTYQSANIPNPVNVSTFDYDNVTLSTAAASTTVNESASNETEDCAAKTLTADTINCTGVLSYLWSSGETSADITKLVGSGLYSVDVDCTIPLSSDTDSITI